MMYHQFPIYGLASTVPIDNERIRIPKLEGTEIYCLLSTYVQANLESKGYWDIVTGTRKAPRTPESDRVKRSTLNAQKAMRMLRAYWC